MTTTFEARWFRGKVTADQCRSRLLLSGLSLALTNCGKQAHDGGAAHQTDKEESSPEGLEMVLTASTTTYAMSSTGESTKENPANMSSYQLCGRTVEDKFSDTVDIDGEQGLRNQRRLRGSRLTMI